MGTPLLAQIKGFGHHGTPPSLQRMGLKASGDPSIQIKGFGDWGDPSISWDDGIWAVMEANISTENGIGNWVNPHLFALRHLGTGDPNAVWGLGSGGSPYQLMGFGNWETPASVWMMGFGHRGTPGLALG